MNKIFILFFIALSFLSCGQEAPKVLKTEFTAEVLSQQVTSLDGNKQSISDILGFYKGQILVIDFWASWCRDCIKALPETKKLMEENPEVNFVYLSLDRSQEQWKKGLERFEISDKESYWFDEGWKNKFNNYVDLNWIPRFIVVNQQGKIAKYYAISPSDPDILNTIKQLQNN